MRTKRSRLWAILIGILGLGLILSACSSSSQATDLAASGTEDLSKSIENTVETGITEIADSGLVETIQPVLETAVPSGIERSVGSTLDINESTFDSFRITFELLVSGKKEDGAEVNETTRYFYEINRLQPATHFLLETGNEVDSASPAVALETYEVGGNYYMLSYAADGTVSCFPINSQDSAGMMNIPDLMIPPENFTDEHLVKRGELINAIKTDHYKMNEAMMGEGDYNVQAGDVWVAQEGGYIVRSSAEITGDVSGMAGKLTDGSMTWSYELSEVNQIDSLEIPQTCVAATEKTAGFPLPENAANFSQFGNLISFESPDSVEKIGEFYKEEMPANGWTLGAENSYDTMATLTYSKSGGSASIMITGLDGGGTSILITIE
ncbi:MAG: hypothetical protein ABFD29_11785 [Anaerolineaceae bacterium]